MNRHEQDHPYKQYEKLGIWKILEKGIADLVENGDMAEKTARPYIVGYLTKLLVERRLTDAKWRQVQTKLLKTRDASEELVHALSEFEVSANHSD